MLSFYLIFFTLLAHPVNGLERFDLKASPGSGNYCDTFVYYIRVLLSAGAHWNFSPYLKTLKIPEDDIPNEYTYNIETYRISLSVFRICIANFSNSVQAACEIPRKRRNEIYSIALFTGISAMRRQYYLSTLYANQKLIRHSLSRRE